MALNEAAKPGVNEFAQQEYFEPLSLLCAVAVNIEETLGKSFVQELFERQVRRM